MASESNLPLPKAKHGPKGFFREMKRELKKVTWPTVSETNRLTGVVMTVCFILVAILAGLGYTFETLIRILTKGTV